MPKIIFINRFFYPDHSATSQMLSDITFGLAEKGWQVTVITSRLFYQGSGGPPLPSRETTRNVEILRTWSSSFGRDRLVGRAIDYATFYLSTAVAVMRTSRRGDILVAKTDPPMLSILIAPLAWLRGAKLVNWLQDVFPEVAQAIGVGGVPPFVYPLLRRVRDRSLKRSYANVVLGDRMRSRLIDMGVATERIRVIANFADGAKVKPIETQDNLLRQSWGLREKFVVGYSGNFGRAHEHQTLTSAMELLSSPAGREEEGHSRIAWLFVGSGALHGELERAVVSRQIANVHFKPYQPDELLAASLSAPDVHLVSLRPELEGLIVPSKFYGIAAAGRPTIFIGDPDGEIARVIAQHGCGYTVKVGDGVALAQTIRELAADPQRCRQMGERARFAFAAEFDTSIAIGRWEELLGEVGGARSRPV
ncbi:MAG: glycosyltransferase family 4 protein [Hyphomicrobium sp.]